jgi:hypothetical protein
MEDEAAGHSVRTQPGAGRVSPRFAVATINTDLISNCCGRLIFSSAWGLKLGGREPIAAKRRIFPRSENRRRAKAIAAAATRTRERKQWFAHPRRASIAFGARAFHAHDLL